MRGLDTLTHTHTHTHTLALNGSPKFGTRACAKWNNTTRFWACSVSAHCKGVAEKVPLVSRCEAMPKAGPSPLEWKRRLEAFSRGEYAFSTGQKPRKGSRWHKVLCAIEGCPTSSSSNPSSMRLSTSFSVGQNDSPDCWKRYSTPNSSPV